MTKVKPLLGRTGKPVANQYVIVDEHGIEYLQSYNSIIARKVLYAMATGTEDTVELDEKYWNYSVTTSKYRNQFLNESTKETQAKIDSGEYELAELN
jgi:hypothetical protein